MTIQIGRVVISLGRDRHGQPGVNISRAMPPMKRCVLAINQPTCVSSGYIDIRADRSHVGTLRAASLHVIID